MEKLEVTNKVMKKIPNVSLLETGLFKRVGYIVLCSSVASTNIKYKRKDEDVFKGDNDLFGTEYDAQHIYENFMKKGEFVCQGQLVFSGDGVNSPKKEVFLEMLKNFFDSSKNDASIIYYSGHGFRGAKILLETSVGSYEITYEDILSIWRQRENPDINKHLLFLFDCCYSGEWAIEAMKKGDINSVSFQASSSYYQKSQDLGAGLGSMFTQIFLLANGNTVELEKSKLEKKVTEFQPQTSGFRDVCLYKFGLKAMVNSWIELLPSTSDLKKTYSLEKDNIVFFLEKYPSLKDSIYTRVITQSIFKFKKNYFTGQCELQRSETEEKCILYFVANSDKYELDDAVASLYDYENFKYGKLVYKKKRETCEINFEADMKTTIESTIEAIMKCVEENTPEKLPSIEFIYTEMNRGRLESLKFQASLQKENFDLYAEDNINFGDEYITDLELKVGDFASNEELKKRTYSVITKKNSTFKSLTIDCCNYKISFIKELSNLYKCYFLKNLCLKDLHLDDFLLISPLLKYSNLESLRLQEITIYGEYDKCRFLQDLMINKNLKDLEILLNLPLNASESLITDLKNFFSSTSLRRLSLKNFKFSKNKQNIFFLLDEDDIISLRELCLNNCNIKEFNPKLSLNLTFLGLPYNKLNDVMLTPIFNTIKDSQAVKLDLAYNNFSSYESLTDKLTRHKNIKGITLTGNFYTKTSIEKIFVKICTELPLVMTVDLSNTNLGSVGFIKNSLKNSSTVKKLNFSYCNLSELSIKLLAEIFNMSNANRINTLILDGNKIYNKKVVDDVFLILRYNQYLSTLSMNNCFEVTFPSNAPSNSKTIQLDKLLGMKSLSEFYFNENKTEKGSSFDVDISKLKKQIEVLEFVGTEVNFYFKSPNSDSNVIIPENQKLLINSLNLDYLKTYETIMRYVSNDLISLTPDKEKVKQDSFQTIENDSVESQNNDSSTTTQIKSKKGFKLSKAFIDAKNIDYSFKVLDYIEKRTSIPEIQKDVKYINYDVQQYMNIIKVKDLVLLDTSSILLNAISRSLFINKEIKNIVLDFDIVKNCPEQSKKGLANMIAAVNSGQITNKTSDSFESFQNENTFLSYYSTFRPKGKPHKNPLVSPKPSLAAAEFAARKYNNLLLDEKNSLIFQHFPHYSGNKTFETIQSKEFNSNNIVYICFKHCYELKQIISKISNLNFPALEVVEFDSVDLVDLVSFVASFFDTKKITKLKSLIIHNVLLGAEDLFHLQKIISINPLLEEFYFTQVYCESTSKISGIFEFLNKNLVTLGLRHTKLDDNIVSALLSYLNSMAKNSLKKLDLGFTLINAHDLSSVLSYVAENDLEYLNLSGLRYECNDNVTANGKLIIHYGKQLISENLIKPDESIATVQFNGSKFEDKNYLSNFIYDLKNITSIEFIKCFPKYSFMDSLCFVARTKKTLTKITLKGTPLSVDDCVSIKRFLKESPQIQLIDVSSCFLTDEAGSQLLEGLNIDTDDCENDDKEKEKIDKYNNLTHMNLADNFMGKMSLIKAAMVVKLRSKLKDIVFTKAFRSFTYERFMKFYNILFSIDEYDDWRKPVFIGGLEEENLL